MPHLIGNVGSIIVQTRAGGDVPNCQVRTITLFLRRQDEGTLKKHQVIAQRSGPTGMYNCHGLTFASRRTAIEETKEIARILLEDELDEVKLRDVKPGDIVVYWDKTGDAEHSGIVVTNPDDQLGIPMVCSKWGGGSEVLHWLNRCPYDASGTRFYRVRTEP
jgi:hypothetical protein